MFFLINVLFAGIYYYGFFCNAGITYDCNQPHIEFELFKTTNDKGKLVISSRDEESLPSTCSNQDHYYYRTTCQWVLQNTILTSLMQEPTDFFSASGTYTGSFQNNVDRNLITASIFHVFLIFHILVSWILLGVFISLIYQKFRNN